MENPSEAAGDTKGGFHEEGGYWGRDASGAVVVVRAVPGNVRQPDEKKAEIDVMNAADKTLAARVVTVDGTWHVHPSQTSWDGGKRGYFSQRPGTDDYRSAKAPINFVVSKRWNEVNFFNRNGDVRRLSLKEFLGERHP